MTTKELKEIEWTAQHLGMVYHHLQSAYVELAQLDGHWPKGLSEYLYDETYNNCDFETFIRVMVLDLEEMQLPLQSFTQDIAALSSDLQRLGTGA